MLQTLPFVLFIVMTEVAVGSVTVLVLLDWRNEVKRGFLISYALIYLCLAGLTYWFQQSFAAPDLLNTYSHLDKAWTGSLGWPLLIFFLLLIPYSLFILLDKSAGVDGKEQAEKDRAEGKAVRSSLPRILRLISGVATVLMGLVTLLVMAMIFRPIAGDGSGSIFAVLGFFAAAFALGGVTTAMWLGHWYLVTPALTERPLLFSTTIVLLAILIQVVAALLSGPMVGAIHASVATSAPPAHNVIVAPANQIKPVGEPVVTPLSTDAIGWLRILISFVMPLILGGLAWKLVRDRSFQSATGMLYLVVVCTLAGEAMARGLFLIGIG